MFEREEWMSGRMVASQIDDRKLWSVHHLHRAQTALDARK
jgi:hypothetical protein